MTMVVSIDPGLRACGVAIFWDGVLVRAAYVKNPEKKARGPEAWKAMAQAVYEWMSDTNKPGWTKRPHVLVLEVPQVYRAGQQKGDPDDLIQLAGVDGCVVGLIGPDVVRAYLPREWKGQVPKEIHNARVMRELTEEEKAAIEPCAPSLLHNVIDGIGIGLYFLKR